jgi:hypothetical protein
MVVLAVAAEVKLQVLLVLVWLLLLVKEMTAAAVFHLLAVMLVQAAAVVVQAQLAQMAQILSAETAEQDHQLIHLGA